ncbi:hypothetical protein SAMN05216273_11386 [Chryseobacterium taihuense]|uniref:Uncharacterized protein n=1 Tax=Chryseobacterium taihuense TaxID=1141221 RepID=A0ABY0QYJ4_9FLAO|nr:hypothetical protein SAMN05216273_11386 [Chryseobacterium taihuense]
MVFFKLKINRMVINLMLKMIEKLNTYFIKLIFSRIGRIRNLNDFFTNFG